MWKVYDYMEGQDGNPRFQSRGKTIYGPLPCKRWVPAKGEKRHKVRHSSKVSKVSHGTAKEYNTWQAVAYAEWLAERDGVSIPKDCKVSAVWGQVSVPGKAKPEARVRAVEWASNGHQPRGEYVKRKWVMPDYVEGKVELTINIPHWDWVPSEPVEVLEDGVTALANSLTTEQYLRLLDVAYGPLSAPEAAMTDDELLAELEG